MVQGQAGGLVMKNHSIKKNGRNLIVNYWNYLSAVSVRQMRVVSSLFEFILGDWENSLKLVDLYLQANKRYTFTSMAKSFMCERSVSDANDGRIVAYGRIIVG